MVLISGQNAFALPAKMECTSILDEWARVNYPSGNFVHDVIPPVIIDGKNTSFFIKAEQSTKNDNHIQLEMKLLDRNDHVMKNSKFFVELSQDDKIIHRDLFYTDSGTLVLDFDQNNSTKEITVDAEQANMGYFFSSNDHIAIKSPTLDGAYQIKVMAMGACDKMVFFFPQEAVPVFRGSFLVSDGYVTSVTVLKDSNPEKIASPLKQIKSGIKYHNVQCNEGLELVYKKGDNTSACVALETKIELTVRGWAEDSRILLGCIGERVNLCYPEDKDEYRKSLERYYYGFSTEPNSKISVMCMTLEKSKETATFFKVPSHLPDEYSFKCSFSGTPYESYMIFHNKKVPDGWISQYPQLISDGAIFIYQTDRKSAIGEKEFAKYGSATQRIQDTYDDIMMKNPSLHPQLIRINGMLAYAVDSCSDCGIQTANFTDGTVIQKSVSTEATIKFIDENGVSYFLKAGIPLNELIKVAESLQGLSVVQ